MEFKISRGQARAFPILVAIGLLAVTVAAQKTAKKVELPHPFYWAAPDPLRGDWQGEGGYVAQVIRADDKVRTHSVTRAWDAGPTFATSG